MPRIPLALLLTLTLGACSAAADQQPEKTLPRMESLREDLVYGRRGPGRDHKIDWTYTRKGLPVRVLEESDGWRKVRDPLGGVVWMHESKLASSRTVYVAKADARGEPLHKDPRPDSRIVARLGEGVVARLDACRSGWRKVAVEGREGWIRSASLWGAETCVESMG